MYVSFILSLLANYRNQNFIFVFFFSWLELGVEVIGLLVLPSERMIAELDNLFCGFPGRKTKREWCLV